MEDYMKKMTTIVEKIQKIQNGESALLSVADITLITTNMTDAKNNLSSKDYTSVFKLFSKLLEVDEKIEMNSEKYLETAVEIIKLFDKKAPFIEYSGGDKKEYSLLLEDIYREEKNKEMVRGFKDQGATEENIKKLRKLPFEKLVEISDEKYNQQQKNALNDLEYSHAKEFLELLKSYEELGKKIFLEKYDSLVHKIVKKKIQEDPLNKLNVSLVIHRLNEVLFDSNILIEFEDYNMNQHYNNIIFKDIDKK